MNHCFTARTVALQPAVLPQQNFHPRASPACQRRQASLPGIPSRLRCVPALRDNCRTAMDTERSATNPLDPRMRMQKDAWDRMMTFLAATL